MQKEKKLSCLYKIKHLRRPYALFILFVFSFIISIFSHLFFLTEWLEGRYMTGMNDGLSQMLPFKQLLYNQYKDGELFYSPDFGFGGGTYTQLGYYFSNSIFFIITSTVTLFLDTMGFIKQPDLYYWADAIIFMSIIRMTIIIIVTTFYFRSIKMDPVPAFIGSIVYSSSIIYFRHVTYWEFFTDAMIWFPLLLIGIEKIIRKAKGGLFLLAVSISLFDNFYFAYINFILVGLYILFRWLIPLSETETAKIKQIKLYVITLFVGFCISGVSFFPAIYGYLNNYRPTYEEEVLLFDFVDNILINGRITYLPAFVLMCLMFFSFYKIKLFRFFALFTILLSIMHFSPLIGSIFNGFSAPQYRWEYFLSLTAGGVTASALPIVTKIKKKQLLVASIFTIGLYILFYRLDPKLIFKELSDAYMVIVACIIIINLFILVISNNKHTGKIMAILLVSTSIVIANFYQEKKLTKTGTEYRVSKEFMMSDEYNGPDQRELIQLIQEQESDPLARIDWMVDLRNNTPIVQEFKGMSVYSSILNKYLLWFYLNDLEIDTGRESVSRYASLGDRANLYSMFMGKYYIAKREDEAIPYGFEKIASSGDYVAYKNENILPFVRATNKVFLEKELKNISPVAKEQAMLTGIVLEEGNSNAKVPESRNIIHHTSIETVNSSLKNGIMEVTEAEGGVDLILDQSNPSVKDYYVEFYMKGIKNKKEFNLQVNDFITIRKEADSIYRTNVNKLVIRVKADEVISLRVPKGSYELRGFKLYEETYEVLKQMKKDSNTKKVDQVSWSGNRLSFTYINEEDDQFAAIPLPYEKGWYLTVNGEKQDILKANYAFTGFKIKEGINEVELVYYPPFFFQLLFLSFSSILGLILYMYIQKKYTNLKYYLNKRQ